MSILIRKDLSWLPKAHRYALITDETVAKLHGQNLLKELLQAKKDVILLTIPPGEQSKTRKEKEKLEDALSQANFGRDGAIIALGGGVVTDLAGFVAATYNRGISYVSLPTTLLGMVDASIGGKVGVNTSFGKNHIGAFYPPQHVVIDHNYLETLPQAHYLSGLAEIIKYGLIASPSILDGDLLFQIEESCRIKNKIVKADPKELGLRRILNFGHTVGHAIEQAYHFSISHGYAVAVGMRIEARLSCRLGYLSQEELNRIENYLSIFPHLEISDQIIEIMNRDKKAKKGAARFVILKSIGQVVSFDGDYCTPIQPKIIQEVLDEYCHQS